MRAISVVLMLSAVFVVSSCDGGKPSPVLDLSFNPLADFSLPAVSTPTCVPPGTVQCPSGTFFAASPTVSGCFTNGTTVPGSITPPVENPPSGMCPSRDNVVSCDTPATCSFCFPNTAAIPVGCYKM